MFGTFTSRFCYVPNPQFQHTVWPKEHKGFSVGVHNNYNILRCNCGPHVGSRRPRELPVSQGFWTPARGGTGKFRLKPYFNTFPAKACHLYRTACNPIVFLYWPEQTVMLSWQPRLCLLSPRQGRPPNMAGGLLHSLVRVEEPAQPSQSDQTDHGLHEPWTTEWEGRKIKIK